MSTALLKAERQLHAQKTKEIRSHAVDMDDDSALEADLQRFLKSSLHFPQPTPSPGEEIGSDEMEEARQKRSDKDKYWWMNKDDGQRDQRPTKRHGTSRWLKGDEPEEKKEPPKTPESVKSKGQRRIGGGHVLGAESDTLSGKDAWEWRGGRPDESKVSSIAARTSDSSGFHNEKDDSDDIVLRGSVKEVKDDGSSLFVLSETMATPKKSEIEEDFEGDTVIDIRQSQQVDASVATVLPEGPPSTADLAARLDSLVREVGELKETSPVKATPKKTPSKQSEAEARAEAAHANQIAKDTAQALEALRKKSVKNEMALVESYEERIRVLRREMFDLKLELKEAKTRDPRHHVATGGSLLPVDIDAETLKALEQEMREQEAILQGYQRENEKLVQRVKELEGNVKQAREQAVDSVGQDPVALRSSTDALSSRGALLQSKIQLELELQQQQELAKTRETEFQFELDKLRHTCRDLQGKLAGVDVTRMKMEDDIVKRVELKAEDAKKHHLKEVAALEKRIAWYVKNQDMVDKNDKLVLDQKETIMALQAQVSDLTDGRVAPIVVTQDSDNARRAKAEAAQQRRLKDLEKQVADLELIVRERNPNSLAAMVASARPSVEESAAVQSLRAQLEQAEADRSKAGEDAEKGLRALRQQHERMTTQYEEQISALQASLKAKGNAGGGSSKQRIKELERTLDASRQTSRLKIRDLEQRLEAAQRMQNRADHRKPTTPVRKSAPVAVLERVKELESDLEAVQHKYEASEKARNALVRQKIGEKVEKVEVGCQMNDERKKDDDVLLQQAKQKEQVLLQRLEAAQQMVAAPSTQEYHGLMNRLNDMERRHALRERTLGDVLNETRRAAKHEMGLQQARYETTLHAKDAEIARFRSELEQIIVMDEEDDVLEGLLDLAEEEEPAEPSTVSSLMEQIATLKKQLGVRATSDTYAELEVEAGRVRSTSRQPPPPPRPALPEPPVHPPAPPAQVQPPPEPPEVEPPISFAARIAQERAKHSAPPLSLIETSKVPRSEFRKRDDPLQGLAVAHWLMDEGQFKASVAGRRVMSLASLESKREHLSCDDSVVVGVLMSCGPTKTSKAGNKMLVVRLHDLKGASLSLFLFGAACDKHFIVVDGSVVAILSPKILPARERNGAISLSISKAEQLICAGQSRDFGQCSGTKKDGGPCGMVLDKRFGTLCSFHSVSAFRRSAAGRPALNSVPGRDPFAKRLTKRPYDMSAAGTFSRGTQSFTSRGSILPLPKARPRPPSQDEMATKARRLQQMTRATIGDAAPALNEGKSRSQRQLANVAGFTLPSRPPPVELQHDDDYAGDRALAAAVAVVRAQGGIPAPDPNAVRPVSTMTADKASRMADEARVQSVNRERRSAVRLKQAAMKAQGITGPVVLESLDSGQVSRYDTAAQEETMKNTEQGLDWLEKRDLIATKASSVTQLKIKVWHCEDCMFTTDRYPSACRDKGHALSHSEGVKRYFACAGCKHRIEILTRFPTQECAKCGKTSWTKAPVVVVSAF